MKINTLNENMTEKDNREFWDIFEPVANAVNSCGGDADDIHGEITHTYSDEDRIIFSFLSTTGKKGVRSFNYRVRQAVTKALEKTRFNDHIDVVSNQMTIDEVRYYVPRGMQRDFEKHYEMFKINVVAYDDKSTPSSFKDVLGEDYDASSNKVVNFHDLAYDIDKVMRYKVNLKMAPGYGYDRWSNIVVASSEEEAVENCKMKNGGFGIGWRVVSVKPLGPASDRQKLRWAQTVYDRAVDNGDKMSNRDDMMAIRDYIQSTLYNDNGDEQVENEEKNMKMLGAGKDKDLKESAPRFYVTIYAQDSVSGPEEGGYTSHGWEPFKSKFFRGEDEARDFMDSWIKGMEIVSKEANRIHVKDDYDDEYIVALEHGGNRGRTEESPRTWAQAEFDAPNPRKYFDKSGRRLYNNPYADAKRARELKALEKSFADRIESATTKEDIVAILADLDYVKISSIVRDKLKTKWDEIVGNSLKEDNQFKLSGRLLPIEVLGDTPQKQRAVLTQEVADKLEKFLRANRLWVDEFYFNSMNKTIEFDINWGDWKHEHMRAKWLIEDFFGDKDEFVRIDSYETEEDGSDTYSAHYTLK